MSSINITALEDVLQNKISATGTSSVDDILAASIACGNLADISVTIPTVSQLPNLFGDSEVPLGTVVFVDELNIPLVACQTGWFGLDGTVYDGYYQEGYGFGYNTSVLGTGNTSSTSSPVSIYTTSVWKQILISKNTASAVYPHSCGIDYFDNIYSWGYNSAGQLGNGSVISKTAPTPLISPFNSWTWKQISISDRSTSAIKTDGSLWAWGYNGNGQFGDGTNVSKRSPVSLVSPFNSWTWKQISGGTSFKHAIRSDNTLWSWGAGSYGQLGDGTTIDKWSPVSLVSPFNSWTWKQISAGSGHSIAIKSDDTLWSWGYNVSGQLGDGTQTMASSPVSLVSPFNSWTWKQVSAGGYNSLAIKSDDTLWSWGNNDVGQIGDNTTTVNRLSPVSVVGGFTWKSVSSGKYYAIAISSDNTLWSWGKNNKGQLGDGTTVNRSSPVPLVAPYNSWNWKQVSAGYQSSFGVTVRSL